MDHDREDDGPHKRRSKRSLVLLTAKIRTPKGVLDVRLRNLSQNGALLESETLPEVGCELVFERGDTIVPARVAWASNGRFGIEFVEPIEESEVLVHVGRGTRPPSRHEPPSIYRRTGFRGNQLSREDREVAAAWVRPQGRAD